MSSTTGNAIFLNPQVGGFDPLDWAPSAYITARRGVKSDTAVQFNVNDKSLLQGAANYDPATSDFSISLWVYLDTRPASQTFIATGGSADGEDGFNLSANGAGNLVLGFNDSVQATRAAGTFTTGIAATTWTHLVFTFDRDGVATCYLNGTADDVTVDISGQAGSLGATFALRVGGLSTTSSFFDGRIAALSIWNRLLTTAEITHLYNSGAGRTIASLDSHVTLGSSDTGRVHAYAFCEDRGTRYDSWDANHLGQQFGTIIDPTTPTANGGFETAGGGGADVLASWTEYTSGASTITKEGVVVRTGAGALALNIDGSNSLAYVRYGSVLTAGKLYQYQLYARADAGTPGIVIGGLSGDSVGYVLSTDYTLISSSYRTLGYFAILRGTATGRILYADDVTLRAAEILSAPGIARASSEDANFAVSLNGTAQSFSYSGTAFNPGTGDCAMGMAFYLDSLPQSVSAATLFSAGTAGVNTDYYWVRVNSSGQLVVDFNDSSGAQVSLTSTNMVSPGVWYTLVVNFDRDGNATPYVNGSATGWGAGSIAAKSVSVDPGNLWIGRYAGAANNFLAGRMDSPFWANRLLTATEIAAMHNGGRWRQWWELAQIAALAGLTNSVIKMMLEFDNSAALGTDATGNGNTFTNNGTVTRIQGTNYYTGAVGRWEDLGTGGNHATQSSLSKRPVYERAKIGAQPALSFDTTQILTMANLSSASAGTVYAIVKPGAVAGPHYILASADEAGTTRYWGLRISGTKLEVVQRDDDTAEQITGNTVLVAGTAYVVAVRSSGTAYSLWVNGVEQTLTVTAGANNGDWWGDTSARDNFAVGMLKTSSESGGFNGQIAEVAAYPLAHSDDQVRQWCRKIGALYGISV